jgi:hypothetical protein
MNIKATRKRTYKPRMKQFCFQHTDEMREFLVERAEHDSIALTELSRMIFNAGVTAYLGVEVRGNKPITAENKAA